MGVTMARVTVTIEFDLARLNGFLGNTPAVTPYAAMTELLDSLFQTGRQDCPVCGEQIQDGPPLIGCYILNCDESDSPVGARV